MSQPAPPLHLVGAATYLHAPTDEAKQNTVKTIFEAHRGVVSDSAWSGGRVKTDRRDARKLAELLRAGISTDVRQPSEADEALQPGRKRGSPVALRRMSLPCLPAQHQQSGYIRLKLCAHRVAK